MKQAFAALPPRAEIVNLAVLSLLFAAWFGLCYGGGAFMAQYIPWRLDVQLPVDSQLPFWPGAAALYLTITPMLLLAPFVLRDLASLLPLFLALMLETGIAALAFLLLPVDDAPIACCEPGVSAVIFRIADAINLHHNNLPSLHVAFACTLALAFAPRASKSGALALYLWALLVSVSTLFTRQHFVVDVLAGAVLAMFCWKVAARSSGRWLAAFDIELLVLRNLRRFAARHRRYFFIGIAVVLAGIPRWRRERLVRTGFAFLQALDDILDGDRRSAREPLEVADEMLASMLSGVFERHELARLGAAFRADLLARGGSDALDTVVALIRAMRNDRCRVLARVVSTRDQLRAIHQATFANSIDVMMLGADSPIRHGDVPLLIEALGWCSTVRDLREDLAQGLINIPAEVLAAASVERPGQPLPLVVETEAVRGWLRQENRQARDLLDRVEAQLAGISRRRGARLLLRFARSMRKYAR